MPPHPHHRPHHPGLHRWLKNYETERTPEEMAEVLTGVATRLADRQIVLGDLTLRPPETVWAVVRAETTPHGTTRFVVSIEWADESQSDGRSSDFAELLG
jgi:hypothetical protein